jgi:hypothetical protein
MNKAASEVRASGEFDERAKDPGRVYVSFRNLLLSSLNVMKCLL